MLLLFLDFYFGHILLFFKNAHGLHRREGTQLPRPARARLPEITRVRVHKNHGRAYSFPSNST